MHTRRAPEREPMMGCWCVAPSGGPGAEPMVGVRGKPPEADEIFVFKILIFNGSAAVLH